MKAPPTTQTSYVFNNKKNVQECLLFWMKIPQAEEEFLLSHAYYWGMQVS